MTLCPSLTDHLQAGDHPLAIPRNTPPHVKGRDIAVLTAAITLRSLSQRFCDLFNRDTDTGLHKTWRFAFDVQFPGLSDNLAACAFLHFSARCNSQNQGQKFRLRLRLERSPCKCPNIIAFPNTLCSRYARCMKYVTLNVARV